MKTFFYILSSMMMMVFQPHLQQSEPLATIEGKVVEKETNEPILFGTVGLYRNGILIADTETDFDGNYKLNDIQPGAYDMEASYVGYNPQRITGIVISVGRTNRVNFDISTDRVLLNSVDIINANVKLIEIDNTTIGSNVTAEKIKHLPTKRINEISSVAAGLSGRDGGDISIRSGRCNENTYFLDGVRVVEDMIPQSEVVHDSLLGGLESQYENIKEIEESKDKSVKVKSLNKCKITTSKEPF